MRTPIFAPWLAWSSAMLLSVLASGAEPVGPEACKSCHPAIHESWKESQHARAAVSLSDKQNKEGRCRNCHAPDQSKGYSSVTCENCHGNGQYYAARYVMKDQELSRAVGLASPSEKTCGKCHDSTAPSLRPFVFAEKLRLIDHWSAQRAARKAFGKAGAKQVKDSSPNASQNTRDGSVREGTAKEKNQR